MTNPSRPKDNGDLNFQLVRIIGTHIVNNMLFRVGWNFPKSGQHRTCRLEENVISTPMHTSENITFRFATFLDEPDPYSFSFSTEQQIMNSFLWAGPASEARE